MIETAAESTIPLLVVNLLFALIALGVGFVSGVFVFSLRGRYANQFPAGGAPANPDKVALERAILASNRLHDLASSVATDVSEHSHRVGQISAELQEPVSNAAAALQERVNEAVTSIVSANDQLQQRLAVAEERIKAQASEIAAHESEARTDSLTGLANRRAFDDEVKRRYSERQRRGTQFTMILLDVDHFKQFNDSHGHQAGDAVLREVAKAIVESTRDMDVPCRYGGEEFAVVLPATPLDDAVTVAERTRRAIADLKVPFEKKSLSVTASFGVAQIDASDDTARLLKRADDALYRSKDAGRNCGHLYAGDVIVPISKGRIERGVGSDQAEIARTDILDGLPNRTIFAEQLRRRIAEAHRTSNPLAVMSVAVCGYSRLRDECGESVARVTLDAVARFLDSTLREMDMLARLDEDCFVVMLPGAEEATAHSVASRADAALSKCSVPMGDDGCRLEVSTGVTQALPDDTAATMLSRVESASPRATPDGAPALV